jgi:hypothetical protein
MYENQKKVIKKVILKYFILFLFKIQHIFYLAILIQKEYLYINLKIYALDILF